MTPSRDSFDTLDGWISDIRTYGAPNAVIVVAGNKVDAAERLVTFEEAQSFCQKNHILAMEVSAARRENVETVFATLVQFVLYNHRL